MFKFYLENGVDNDNFFELLTLEIQEILKYYSSKVVIKFISNYQFEKGLHVSINSNEANSTEEFSVAKSINNANDSNSGLNISFEYVDVTSDVMNDSIVISPPIEPAPALLIEIQACIKPFLNIGMTFL